MDDQRDEFEKELEDELTEGAPGADADAPLMGDEDDLEEDDEDALLDQFGLHRVEEEEETGY